MTWVIASWTGVPQRVRESPEMPGNFTVPESSHHKKKMRERATWTGRMHAVEVEAETNDDTERLLL